jgi:hypothetical protein
MDAVNDPNDYSPSIPEIWRRYQKRPRPKRLLITSIRDSLVTGSFACTEGTGGAFAGGADRWADSFFDGSRLTIFGPLGATSSVIAITGNRAGVIAGSGPGVIWTNSNADRTGCAANTITVGGGVWGRLVSKITRSGNFSIELILIAGLLISLEATSGPGSDTSQLTPNSNIRSAVPTKPKYRANGIEPVPWPLFLCVLESFVCRQVSELSSGNYRTRVSTEDDDD